MIPVEVTGISVSPPYQGYVVTLKEKEGDQWLPIFIGAAEAHTISLLLQGMKYVRPLTYDMFHELLKASACEVRRVDVTELRDNTFFASITLHTPDGDKQIDARPSDAIALALKTESPVFVAEKVFSEAGMRSEFTPSSDAGSENRLEELQMKLQELVETEDYEQAAKVRDLIKNLKEHESSEEKEDANPGEKNPEED